MSTRNDCLLLFEKSPKESLHHLSGEEGCLRVFIIADEFLFEDSHMTTHDNTIEDVHIWSFMSILLICPLFAVQHSVG